MIKAVTFDLWDTMIHDDSDEAKRAAQGLRSKKETRRHLVWEALNAVEPIDYERVALAYDVAICLNAWCFERDRSFNVTKARMLLAAYRKVRPFSEEELQALPTLTRGSAMRFLLTRLYDWLNRPEGAFVQPKDPLEYLKILSFHQQVDGPGAYGLD